MGATYYFSFHCENKLLHILSHFYLGIRVKQPLYKILSPPKINKNSIIFSLFKEKAYRQNQESTMQITLLKSKIHRVTTTHSELDYEGSCAIDGHLLDVAGIREFEQIQIYNINNGERFTTYAIRAEDNSGIISVNGAAAHKANPQDLLIIATYVVMEEVEADAFKPKLIYVDTENSITHTRNTLPTQVKQAS